MDVLGLDRALNRAKDELERAIEAEKAHAIGGYVRRSRPLRLELTEAMQEPLRRLLRIGVREAAAELRRAGYEVERASAAAIPEPRPDYDRLAPVVRMLRAGLAGLGIRVERETIEIDFSEVVGRALERALIRVTGARDVASRLVSSALTAGLAQTFEQADALGEVAGYEYTAVLDKRTCSACSPNDGRVFRSWLEVDSFMPSGGPFPGCLGGPRCRCRCVPLPAE